MRLDGKTVSESDVNSLYAATHGVPVGLVTGDDVICGLVSATSPSTENRRGETSARVVGYHSLPPSLARAAIRDASRRAVQQCDSLNPTELHDEWVLEIVHPTTTAAEMAEGVPGSRRTSDRTIEHRLNTVDDIIGLITVNYQLASAASADR